MEEAAEPRCRIGLCLLGAVSEGAEGKRANRTNASPQRIPQARKYKASIKHVQAPYSLEAERWKTISSKRDFVGFYA